MSSHLARAIAALLVVVAAAPAHSQSGPSGNLPDLPVQFTVSDAPRRGLTVRCVTAGTKTVLADIKVRVEPGEVAPADDGSFPLAPGRYWLEATAPGHLPRRQAVEVTAANARSTLELPLLPRARAVTVKVTPPYCPDLSVAGPSAAPPPFPAVGPCNEKGEAIVWASADATELDLVATLTGCVFKAKATIDTQGVRDLQPWKQVPAARATVTFAPTPADERLLRRYLGRFASRSALPATWRPVVEAALIWLVKHQEDDGHWSSAGFMARDRSGAPCDGAGSPAYDVGATALALLAFLADGQTPRRGPHREAVGKAIDWLLKQRDEQGIIATSLSGERASDFIYEHAIATLALSEAVGMSHDEVRRPAVAAAVAYLESHRNPYGVWRYAKQAVENDMSITKWGAEAMAVAIDFGLVPAKPNGRERIALEFSVAYADEMTNSSGETGYVERGTTPNRIDQAHRRAFPAGRDATLTAAGLVIHYFTDARYAAPAVARLALDVPNWNAARPGCTINYYGWMIGAQAAWLVGDTTWKPWAAALTETVVKHQRRDGNAKGSWDPIDVWGNSAGRVGATAMAVLALLAPQRFGRS